jgi:hypothetical protein
VKQGDRTYLSKPAKRVLFATAALMILIRCCIPAVQVTGRSVAVPQKDRSHFFGRQGEDASIDVIAQLTGPYTSTGTTSIRLLHVNGGQVIGVGRDIGLSLNFPRIDQLVTWRSIVIAMERITNDDGSANVNIVCNGQNGAVGTGSGLSLKLTGENPAVVKQLVWQGQETVIYAEGSVTPTLTAGMSIAEFCKYNKGNFVVVTLQP